MTGLVKSPLQIAVVEGIYNDILTKNARYYYFLGKTSPWTVADGADVGVDGTWVSVGSTTVLSAPAPSNTFRYELDTRNNLIAYKLVKPSDVAFVIPRYNWTANRVWDMYDDSYSSSNLSYSGSSTIEDAKYFVLTSMNNVYKCISNNYNALSTVEPSGTSSDEYISADGYIWKFMYNIPFALQNKFYTADYIPVMTSLRNHFYENGAISSVAVLEPGAGYTNSVSFAVAGDGFLENNPYAVGQFGIISNGGAGYKSTIAMNGATWVNTVATISSVAHGFNNNDLITIRGVTPSNYNGDYVVANKTADTFEVTIATDPGAWSNGGAITLDLLTFSAPLWGNSQTQIDGYATITGGVITTVTCDSKTATIVKSTLSLTWITNTATVTTIGAHGFLSGDSIIIANVTPAGYNGTFVVANAIGTTFTYTLMIADPGSATVQGTATKINAQNVYGYGYDQTGTVTAAPPFIRDYDWAKDAVFLVNKIIQANDNFYSITPINKVTQSLTWLTNVTTVTTTTPHGFTTGDSIVIAGITPDAYNGTFTIVRTGDTTFTYALGVSNPGTASVQGTSIQASATTNGTLPIHQTGTIIFGSCSLLFIGSQAKLKLALGKTEAILSPILQGGQIVGVIVTDGGVGYTYCNIVAQDSPVNTSAILVPDLSIGNIDTTQADVELMAQGRNGALSYIKMIYNPITGGYMVGAGYAVASTTITITGDGSGATAIPVVVNGSIIGITLTNRGTGYKHEANVTITSSNGTGALARAILCPPGGHGSNAIREFNSKTILFYSVLSDERIHGIQNLNDYRQFGVVKNPTRYGSTSRLSLTSGTPCWLITSTSNINISNFLKDDLLQQNGESYRVVEIKNDKMVVQSFALTPPTISDFTNVTGVRSGNTVSVSSLTAPQVDKFTGDLLFLDNKLPFVVTVDQMVVFRTTISF